MSLNAIFGNTMTMTQKSLDYLWLKQSVTTNNIANNDTPGFKAQYVTFEDSLKRNLQGLAAGGETNASVLQQGIERSGFSVHNTTDSARLDGNNVQIEAENTELARSYLQYQYQLQSLNSDISRLRAAIRGQ
ncbi:MAG: flagellar basal body rod protein FlgB [Hungatella sp.]